MSIIDLLFPVSCLECKSSGKYLCQTCLSKVRYAKQVCIECMKPSIDGFTHVKCMRKQALDGVFSVWNYEGVVRKAILKLKYNFAYDIAKNLSCRIVEFLKKESDPLPQKALLVPVPLHRLRSNWRGFNQADEVGRLLASKLYWDFNSEVLTRMKKATPQVELRGDERRQNVKGVFAFSESFKSLVLSFKSLVIFDDVLTTGATIREAGKVLKRNGAKKIWGLTIAS